MKKKLEIIGVGLIAGSVVYVLWNKIHKNKKVRMTIPKKETNDIKIENSVSVVNNNVYGDDKFNNFKSSSLNAISTRHEEASKVMKDAFEIICKRSKVSNDDNRELEQNTDKLDELLSEE